MSRIDPLRNFRFRVEIDNVSIAAFSEVVIGATTTAVVDYREGPDPSHVRKLSGLTSFGNVTLRYGVVTNSLDLFKWHQQVIAGGLATNRKKVVIVVQDEGGADMARFVVSDAWPTKYEVGALSAKGNEVLIELLELANEGIERVS
jgi:phage tail-like protein